MNTFTKMLVDKKEGKTGIDPIFYNEGLKVCKPITCDIYGKICYGFIAMRYFYFTYNVDIIKIDMEEINNNINMELLTHDKKQLAIDIEENYILLNKALTIIEHNTDVGTIKTLISSIDKIVKQLETHIDNNYVWNNETND